MSIRIFYAGQHCRNPVFQVAGKFIGLIQNDFTTERSDIALRERIFGDFNEGGSCLVTKAYIPPVQQKRVVRAAFSGFNVFLNCHERREGTQAYVLQMELAGELRFPSFVRQQDCGLSAQLTMRNGNRTRCQKFLKAPLREIGKRHITRLHRERPVQRVPGSNLPGKRNRRAAALHHIRFGIRGTGQRKIINSRGRYMGLTFGNAYGAPPGNFQLTTTNNQHARTPTCSGIIHVCLGILQLNRPLGRIRKLNAEIPAIHAAETPQIAAFILWHLHIGPVAQHNDRPFNLDILPTEVTVQETR